MKRKLLSVCIVALLSMPMLSLAASSSPVYKAGPSAKSGRTVYGDKKDPNPINITSCKPKKY